MMNFIIFLFAFLIFSMLGFLLIWIGNKVFNSIKKNDYKLDKELQITEKELSKQFNFKEKGE